MGGRGSISGTSMPWLSTIQLMSRSGLVLDVILAAYSMNFRSKPISMSWVTTGVGWGRVFRGFSAGTAAEVDTAAVATFTATFLAGGGLFLGSLTSSTTGASSFISGLWTSEAKYWQTETAAA